MVCRNHLFPLRFKTQRLPDSQTGTSGISSSYPPDLGVGQFWKRKGRCIYFDSAEYSRGMGWCQFGTEYHMLRFVLMALDYRLRALCCQWL